MLLDRPCDLQSHKNVGSHVPDLQLQEMLGFDFERIHHHRTRLKKRAILAYMAMLCASTFTIAVASAGQDQIQGNQ